MTQEDKPVALRIISTGGTFEKTYDPIKGSLTFEASHLETIRRRARLNGPVSIEILMLIDSLDMLDSHRQKVLESCQASAELNIVVIHGTDTVVDTARILARASLPKTIVLTGAMVPYDVVNSDALFNLGFAVAAAQLSPPGVYVAMNGQIFDWNRVRKNRDAGCFEPS